MNVILRAQDHRVIDQHGDVLAFIPPWIEDRDRLAAVMAAAPDSHAALQLCLRVLKDLRALGVQAAGANEAISSTEKALQKINGAQP